MNPVAAQLRQSKSLRRNKGCPTWLYSSVRHLNNPPPRPTVRDSLGGTPHVPQRRAVKECASRPTSGTRVSLPYRCPTSLQPFRWVVTWSVSDSPACGYPRWLWGVWAEVKMAFKSHLLPQSLPNAHLAKDSCTSGVVGGALDGIDVIQFVIEICLLGNTLG